MPASEGVRVSAETSALPANGEAILPMPTPTVEGAKPDQGPAVPVEDKTTPHEGILAPGDTGKSTLQNCSRIASAVANSEGFFLMPPDKDSVASTEVVLAPTDKGVSLLDPSRSERATSTESGHSQDAVSEGFTSKESSPAPTRSEVSPEKDLPSAAVEEGAEGKLRAPEGLMGSTSDDSSYGEVPHGENTVGEYQLRASQSCLLSSTV